VRYRAAVRLPWALLGEEAHSRQRDSCPWSKPVNLMWRGDLGTHVLDPRPIVMVHTFADESSEREQINGT